MITSLKDDAIILAVLGFGAYSLWKKSIPKIDIGAAMAHDAAGNVDIGKTASILWNPNRSSMSALDDDQTAVLRYANDHNLSLAWRGSSIDPGGTVTAWAAAQGGLPVTNWYGGIDIAGTLNALDALSLPSAATAPYWYWNG